MSEQDRNDELEAFIQRRSDFNRAYRHAAEELPPRSLDAAILDAARRAVAPRRKPWAMRWGPPLAAAAVLALAVAVTLQLRDQADLAVDATKPGPQAAAPFERRQAETDDHGQPQDTSQGQARSESKRDNGAQSHVFNSGQAKRSKPQGAIAADPPPIGAQAEVGQEPQPALQADRGDAAAAARETAPQSGSSPMAKSSKEETQPAARPAQPAEAALAQIRQQFGRGEVEQADRALRQFCLDFPHYSVPKDLAARAARLAPACRNIAAE